MLCRASQILISIIPTKKCSFLHRLNVNNLFSHDENSNINQCQEDLIFRITGRYHFIAELT